MKLAEVGGDRFWEAWREGDTVHAVSGSGAGKPRTTHKAFPDEAAAENDLQARFRAKFREGWVFQAPDPDTAGWHPTLMTQVSRVHTGFLSIDYSPARDLIAVGRPLDSTPTPTCELVRIDPRSGAVRDTVPLKTFDLWQVRFAPDGDRIYVRADGLVACVEPATQARTRHFATPPFTFLDFQLSRGGRRLLGSDHSRMVVKDLDSGALLLERPLTELREHRHSRAAALSP
ncbi:MAG: hypothetical protein K0Q72_5450, partial [Armatimonadetes bacterium]|nr:hypothetical protein [Armatimonadota bacterium]